MADYGQPHPWDGQPGSHPWDDIGMTLVSQYPGMSKDWMDMNFGCDDWIRGRITRCLDRYLANASGTTRDYFLIYRASMYAYWHAFSKSISDCILWEESEGHHLVTDFIDLEIEQYAEVCSIMYCATIVMQQHESAEECCGLVGLIGCCFGVSDDNGPAWLEFGRSSLSKQAIAFPVMMKLNSQINKIFGMKSLDLSIPANVESKDRVKWEGITSIVMNAHKRMSGRPNIMAWTETAFNRKRSNTWFRK